MDLNKKMRATRRTVSPGPVLLKSAFKFHLELTKNLTISDGTSVRLFVAITDGHGGSVLNAAAAQAIHKSVLELRLSMGKHEGSLARHLNSQFFTYH
jgi:serine/threonine protein phosphatase PrpC